METYCTSIIVFGISGDLARKKIFSALYELAVHGHRFEVVGVGRSAWDDSILRDIASEAIRDQVEDGKLDEQVLATVIDHLGYVRGEYCDTELYEALASRLERHDHILCYLAVPPPVFDDIIVGLAEEALRKRARLLIEKPFGSDANSSRELAELAHKHFLEQQLFAVDHYLEKESLQNISVLRFANRIFEPIWNSENIESVAITMSEEFGIGQRAGFFDQTGTLRDVVQSHGLQIVAALGMEQPESNEASSVDDRRSELLQSVLPLRLEDVTFGQYAGYKGIEGVVSESKTDTFVRASLSIQNERWKNVAWTITAGKALAETCTDVVVTFRPAATVGFISNECLPEQNRLTLRLSPTESLTLSLQTRSATLPLGTTRAEIVSDYAYRKEADISAYARMFMDAAKGDHTQFSSMRVVELSWQIVEPLLSRTSEPLPYQPGTSGPLALQV